jgi:putative pyruvate formate lyase activating enzyme
MDLPLAKLEDARKHDHACFLCEHRCGVNRILGPLGKCKATHQARVFRQRVEYGDEREIAPSHLFYLSGCDLRCVFCINELNAFDPSRGEELTPKLFGEALAAGKHLKPKTLQWVGGEPTIHLPRILEVMSQVEIEPKIVWKTDGHGTPEAYDLLRDVADIYLVDFKFGNDHCARELSGIENYVSILTRNLEIMQNQGELIIRHLLLPGHLDCCFRPLIEWIHRHFPAAKFSLREGYLPHWQSRHHLELGRPLHRSEWQTARSWVADAGMLVVGS